MHDMNARAGPRPRPRRGDNMRAIFRLTAIPATPRRGIPALTVTLPALLTAGTYAATVVHSVA